MGRGTWEFVAFVVLFVVPILVYPIIRFWP